MSWRRAKLIPDAAGDIVPLMFAQFGLSIADVNNICRRVDGVEVA